MITDAQNRPTTVAQSLAGAAATTVSTDTIDLLTANRNVGRSYPMRMFVAATVAFTGGTSVQVQVITSASANLSSPTVIATGAVIAEANAFAGAVLLDAPIPGTAQRYLGLQFTTVGVHTTGSVQGVLVAETNNQPYIAMNTGL
jgi:hypothetical protein